MLFMINPGPLEEGTGELMRLAFHMESRLTFDTIEGDGTVTVRNRDTTEQERLSVEEAIP